jgi:ABC-type enterochelin transport system substrate-binding protein
VKKVMLLVAILMLLILAACRPVADARTQACDAMRDASQKATTTKDAVQGSRPVQTVVQVRATVTEVRKDIQTAQAIVAAVKNSDNTVQLLRALDQIEAGMEGEPDQTVVSTLQDKLSGPVTAAQQNAAVLYDAVCAAK